MNEIDPVLWYSEREVTGLTPKHFTRTKTPLTSESKLWIQDNLRGRYCIHHSQLKDDTDTFDLVVSALFGYPAFEDPKEAVVYELTWS
jgi:hypothetical protein